jgi:hypothetical protein
MTKDCSFSSPPKYQWDSDGNPIQVRSSSLTFDALDREVEFANGSAITQVLYGPIGKMGLMNGQTPSITRIPLPGGSTAKMVGFNPVESDRRVREYEIELIEWDDGSNDSTGDPDTGTQAQARSWCLQSPTYSLIRRWLVVIYKRDHG